MAYLPCVRLPLAPAAAADAAEPWKKRARPQLSSDSAQKPSSEKRPSLLRESSELPRASVWITSPRPADRAAWCSAAAAAPETSCSAALSTPACHHQGRRTDRTAGEASVNNTDVGLWHADPYSLVCTQEPFEPCMTGAAGEKGPEAHRLGEASV